MQTKAHHARLASAAVPHGESSESSHSKHIQPDEGNQVLDEQVQLGGGNHLLPHEATDAGALHSALDEGAQCCANLSSDVGSHWSATASSAVADYDGGPGHAEEGTSATCDPDWVATLVVEEDSTKQMDCYT